MFCRALFSCWSFIPSALHWLQLARNSWPWGAFVNLHCCSSYYKHQRRAVITIIVITIIITEPKLLQTSTQLCRAIIVIATSLLQTSTQSNRYHHLIFVANRRKPYKLAASSVYPALYAFLDIQILKLEAYYHSCQYHHYHHHHHHWVQASLFAHFE